MVFKLIWVDGPDYIQTYSGRKKGEQAPHLFAIAEDALDAMRRGAGGGGIDPTGAGDQTIVVSGERSVTRLRATSNTDFSIVVRGRQCLPNSSCDTLPRSKTPRDQPHLLDVGQTLGTLLTERI
jgi:hypothetical protein